MKLIKKVSQVIAVIGKVLNSKSKSTQDTYSCDYINKLHTYSDEEQVIGTYMNKPLYRKTISTTFNSTYSESGTLFTWINPNIASIDKIKTLEGYLIGNDRKITTSSGALAMCYMISGSHINTIQVGTASSVVSNGTPIDITIEYTKSTD